MADFPWLRDNLTAAAVKALLGNIIKGDVDRYEIPNIGALNFVLHGALDGGASRSLAMDIHGKGFSAILLTQELVTEDAPPSRCP
jgi:hypothetical protein